MKTFVRMITVFCIFGLFFPEVSKTNIKLDFEVDEKVESKRVPFRRPSEPVNTSLYFEILEEILSLNITDLSKIKAINEILRQGYVENLKLIKDNCLELTETDGNLKCLENGILSVKKNELGELPTNVEDLLLGSCLKMQTYGEEKKCYENLIYQFASDSLRKKAGQCNTVEPTQERVYCFRNLL